MGNGESTEFTFNFPFYEKTNVVVTKNGESATNYQVIGTPGGADADIPYTGGKVVFETAPTVMDCITIARTLPLNRAIDYQPTAKIDPTTLNQDMNYMIEVLKDLQDELETLRTQYAEIADKDSTTTLLARIAAISEDIVAVRAQIAALGNISALRQTVTELSTNVESLNNRTNNMLDYIIEMQIPTAENNYTWYRKYKSGWIEQGGRQSASNSTATVDLPISYENTNYDINLTQGVFAGANADIRARYIQTKTASSFTTSCASGVSFCWRAYGFIG